MNNDVFERRDYKRSRTAYALQCTFEYFATLMVTDAFLSKVLTHLGISDAMIGIIATFVSVAMFAQLGSLAISNVRASTKTMAIVCSSLSQVLFALVYVIPFMPVGAAVKKTMAIVFILVAYSSMYIVWPIIYRWAFKFVSPDKRASFSASKEMLSLGTGIVFTLVTGAVIDRFEGLGNITGAFLFIAVSMAIISICNAICLFSMNKEPMSENAPKKKRLSDIIGNTFGNSGFNKCVIAISMWEFAKYFLVGFMGTFKTSDLLISVSLIQIINMLASGCRIIFSKPIARFSDKHGYTAGFQLGLSIAAVAFLINIVTTKSTWFLVIIYTVLYSVSIAGINSNSYNILYSYVDNDYISEALAIKNCVAGVVGFVAALVAGRLLAVVQVNGNSFMGITMFGQQLLSAISFVITVFVFLYVKFVLAKQKTIE